MRVRIIEKQANAYPGILAEAELHFEPSDGDLAGMKLVGFTIWERRGGGYNVTLPARSYTVNGSKRSFQLLRPTFDETADANIKRRITQAYVEYVDSFDKLPRLVKDETATQPAIEAEPVAA